jgi:hypothetical protein
MPKLPEDNFTSVPPLPPDPMPEAHSRDISRRTMLEYFHVPSAGGRFWRIFSSREKMVEGVKTLAWVIPLTLLIWIYAVREQVVQPLSPNVTNVVVDFSSSDPSYGVQYSGDGQARVNLQLTGPQQSLELVREDLTTINAGHPLGLKIFIPSSMGLGNKQPINIVDSIQSLDLFKNNGVTVQLSQPETLDVDVYKKGQCFPSVQIPASITNVSPDSRFSPTKVAVTGPDSLVQRVASGEIKVVAKLEGYDQLKQPGQYSIPAVPLGFYPPEGTETLGISPNQVNADIVVTASDVDYEITDAIPIYLNTLETTWSRYDVSLTNGDSVANIHVRGPQQAIDSIKSKVFPVKAILDVEPTDAGKDASRALHYELPAGVTVTGEDAAREVAFHLTRRE